MTRHHLVVVNDGHNLHSGLDYACETFPKDTITAMYVDSAADDLGSVRFEDSETATDDWMNGHRERAQRAFDDARAVADEHGVTLETVVAFGPFADTIREYCSHNDVDTVIVGSSDRDAFTSYVVADDVERIANTAPVPVVVV
ncbi:universal stress protein [Haloplanus halobius]|uniref:universal stress protein n=1 Tax=Haloplanus halobius TaxID=2934938 RepID=UPI00200E6C42|nr:universal stress protein [Haloplanus sp. XH21]